MKNTNTLRLPAAATKLVATALIMFVGVAVTHTAHAVEQVNDAQLAEQSGAASYHAGLCSRIKDDPQWLTLKLPINTGCGYCETGQCGPRNGDVGFDGDRYKDETWGIKTCDSGSIASSKATCKEDGRFITARRSIYQASGNNKCDATTLRTGVTPYKLTVAAGCYDRPDVKSNYTRRS